MRMGHLTETDVEKLLLKKIGFYIEEVMPKHFFQDVDVESYMDHVSQKMVYRLKAYLYGKEDVVTSNGVDRYVSIPTSWWQMLKKEHFPEWLLKICPVNEISLAVSRKVTMSITKVCPHINATTDRQHIEFFI